MNLRTMDFWIRTSKLIKENNLTQESFCNECGIVLSTYKGWNLRGIYPNAKQVVDMAKLLKTTPEYLVYGTEPQNELPEDLQSVINKYAK